MPSRKWRDVATRLKTMDGAEIASRLRQLFDQRADGMRSRLGFKFHENPTNTASDAHFFFERSDISRILSVLRQRLPHEVEAIVHEAEKICSHRFDLLGYSDLDYGKSIDWHLDAVHHVCSPSKPFFQINYFDPAQVGDPKVIWELSRHQHLVVLAKAYRLTNDPGFAHECFSQWYSWQEQNVYPIGIHWSSSLEVAFRSLSWLWVWYLLQGCDVVPQGFSQDLLRALSINARYIERFLSTYSSPNTHLLGEAVGLFFLGTLCPSLPSARRWQQTGWRIILEEAVNQVRADGFHFEQSTYYHVYALDFFLHARILAARNQVEIPDWFDQTLISMLDALRLLSQSGLPPSFGDDDGGRVFDRSRNRREHLCDPLSTAAVLFQRSDFKSASGTLPEETLWLLGTEAAQRFDDLASTAQTTGPALFPESGFYVMASDRDPGAQLVIDAGPQGTHNAGHGHADALSVHLSVGALELLCDPGTFEYGGDGKGRSWFRSSPAHNTLSVDGFDQAQAKGPFAWTSLPNTSVERWNVGRHFEIFCGSHDGYARLQPPVIHERWIVHFKSLGWLIRDVALGSGRHSLDVAWHLGPQLSDSSAHEKDNFFCAKDGEGLRILTRGDPGWSHEVRDEWCSPAYGLRIPAKTLHVRFTGQLPTECATFLLPTAGDVNELAPLDFATSEDSAVRAYTFSRNHDSYGTIFGNGATHWTFLGWSSDADLLSFHFSGDAVQSLMLCNASFVDWRGQRLWSSPQAQSWCELTRMGQIMEVVSQKESTK